MMRYQNYSRSLWIEPTKTTLEDTIMGAPVIHFEIMGGKGNQLEKFYGELFGWKIDSNNPMKYGIVDTKGGPGGINGGVGTSQDGNKRVSVYVQVDDLQATLNKVEKLGGKTILPPTEVPGGPKLAMFTDPAGNVTGLLLGGLAG
jgi:predicted enzyme related to lactoylglutathione lyase